ncbi:hypothetical protein SEA_PROVOLONE_3 [Streptomyces phage Provolone]|nr:hypothetical protein SEA_PROVOLONE_3 [Streptomyces phage Provolone]
MMTSCEVQETSTKYKCKCTCLNRETETAPESTASSSLPFGKDVVGGFSFHVRRCA